MKYIAPFMFVACFSAAFVPPLDAWSAASLGCAILWLIEMIKEMRE